LLADSGFQLAYILHAKPFRESSLICEALTQSSGVITIFARKSKYQNPYQVFTPLKLSLKSGKGDLFYIDKLDEVQETLPLAGNALFSAYYVNEIIIKLVKQNADNDYLFKCYQTTLNQLNSQDRIEPILRTFEMALLDCIGVLPDLNNDADSGNALNHQQAYIVHPEVGVLAKPDNVHPSQVFNMNELQLIVEQQWQNPAGLSAAKRLMRQLIHFHLEGKPLKSRQFFRATR
jgi:DNA repair protein RecO (recombination protein O)